MDNILYFFIGGMNFWFVAFFFISREKKLIVQLKKEGIKNKKTLSMILYFYLLVVILLIILLGMLFNLSALVLFIMWLSTIMYNVMNNLYTPGLIEYKDFLGIFVQITSLFGTVGIAVAAYLFKKKS